jgi:hypothetical protein
MGCPWMYDQSIDGIVLSPDELKVIDQAERLLHADRTAPNDQYIFLHRVKVSPTMARLEPEDLTFIENAGVVESLRRAAFLSFLTCDEASTMKEYQWLINDFLENTPHPISPNCFRVTREEIQIKKAFRREIDGITDACFQLNELGVTQLFLKIKEGNEESWSPITFVLKCISNYRVFHQFISQCLGSSLPFWWFWIACVMGYFSIYLNELAHLLYYDDLMWYGLENPNTQDYNYVGQLMTSIIGNEDTRDVLYIDHNWKSIIFYPQAHLNAGLYMGIVEKLDAIYKYRSHRNFDQTNQWITLIDGRTVCFSAQTPLSTMTSETMNSMDIIGDYNDEALDWATVLELDYDR